MSDARENFLSGLRNAHAIEVEALTILNSQVTRLDKYPELQQRVADHIVETENQKRRLQDIMARFNDESSTFKDMTASAMGKTAALGLCRG